MTVTCETGTILITKGICVKLSICDSFVPSLESKCENSDWTERWASYCATAEQPCVFSASCSGGSTCSGDYTYIYAEYECKKTIIIITNSNIVSKALQILSFPRSPDSLTHIVHHIYSLGSNYTVWSPGAAITSTKAFVIIPLSVILGM